MQLPVPADRPVSPTVDPQQLAAQFNSNNIQVDPQLKQYAGHVAGVCCQIIQQKAPTNAVRMVHFNICSQSNWQNATFQQLVAGVLEYCFYVDANMNPVQMQNVLHQSAETIILILASYQLQQYEQLVQLCTQQQIQQANAEVQKMPQIQQIIQQRKSGMRSGMQQQVFNQPPVHNAQVHWGVNPQQHVNQTPTMFAGQQQAPMGMPTQTVFNQPPGMQPQSNAAGTTSGFMDDDDDEDEVYSLSSAPNANAEIVTGPKIKPTGSIFAAAAQAPVANEMPVADAFVAPDEDIGGECVAVSSNWSRDWSIEQPWGLVYNPKTHVLLHVRKNGQTQEEAVSLENIDMNYDAHELELTFPELQAHDYVGEHKDADWADINKVLPVSVNTEKHDELDVGEVIALTDTVMIESNLSLSQHMARGWAKEHGVTIPEGSAFVYSALVSEQSIASSFTGSFTSDALNDRFAKASLRDLVRLMQLTRNEEGPADERMPKVLFDVINSRAIAAVNHALQVNMSLTEWNIGDFVDDYLAIKPALRKEFGDAMAELWSANENKIVQEILFSRTISAYIDGVEAAAADDGSILFVNKASVLSVPWTSAELNIQLPELGAGYVSAEKLPGLHNALKEFLAATPDSLSHYVITVDGMAIEVNKGWLGPDCILLSLA